MEIKSYSLKRNTIVVFAGDPLEEHFPVINNRLNLAPWACAYMYMWISHSVSFSALFPTILLRYKPLHKDYLVLAPQAPDIKVLEL